MLIIGKIVFLAILIVATLVALVNWTFTNFSRFSPKSNEKARARQGVSWCAVGWTVWFVFAIFV